MPKFSTLDDHERPSRLKSAPFQNIYTRWLPAGVVGRPDFIWKSMKKPTAKVLVKRVDPDDTHENQLFHVLTADFVVWICNCRNSHL